MTNFVKTTSFTSKDSLTSGAPGKVIKGAEIDVEFDAIEPAVATTADTASPTFTGPATSTHVTINGTSTITQIDGGTY